MVCHHWHQNTAYHLILTSSSFPQARECSPVAFCLLHRVFLRTPRSQIRSTPRTCVELEFNNIFNPETSSYRTWFHGSVLNALFIYFILYLLSTQLERSYQRFTAFYASRHSGRKLTWLYHLSKGELVTNCFKNRYTLQVGHTFSTFISRDKYS